jgi:hypothetical protein
VRVDVPRRRFFLPTGISEAYADDPRGADLAEGRGEAAGDFAEFLAAGGQLVGARGDVVGVCLVAGAAGFVGFREGYEEGEEGGGDFGGGWEVHGGWFWMWEVGALVDRDLVVGWGVLWDCVWDEDWDGVGVDVDVAMACQSGRFLYMLHLRVSSVDCSDRNITCALEMLRLDNAS